MLGRTTRSHEAYGRALDITNAAAAPPDPGVANALRDLKDAISDYTVQVLAWSMMSADAEQAAKRALLPIDARRAANAKNKSQTPEAPGASVVGTPAGVR